MQMQLPKIDVKRESLATILNEMRNGTLQVPRFQREFVWSLSKTRALLDSLYKEFPIGTFFLWRAPDGIPPLSRPLDELGVETPSPGTKISYILDGQQRLTSLYCAVNGVKLGSRNYGRISIDLEVATRFDKNKDEDFNEDIFVYRSPDNKKFIAVRDLVASVTALQLYENIPTEWKPAYNKIFNLFQTYPFSVVWIQEQTLADAIVIFQRINQAGQKLSRYDLVCANLWRQDFDFRKHVSDVNKELKHRGFGLIDETIFTQSFALILSDQCTTLAELSLETDQVKNHWKKVIRALKLAIDFAANNLGVKRIDFLPYRGQLVVLAYYFYHRKSSSLSVKDREMLWNWFWRVTLSERYSSTSPMKMAEDAKKMRAYMAGQEAIFNYPSTVTVDNILRTKMGSTSSALRNSVLCMLALKQPLNFKDNSPVNLYNEFFSNLKQVERHHIYPISYLKTHGISPEQIHLLPNFCFIPSDLNKEITSHSPFEYLKIYQTENPNFKASIATHLIPIEAESPIWSTANNAFETFLTHRAQLLANELAKLVDAGPVITQLAEEVLVPANDVDLLEVRIRDFIDERLVAIVGNHYWKSTIPSDVISQVKLKIDDHISRHPYLDRSDFTDGRSRLDYCDVSDYEKILLKNWDVFGEHFVRKSDLQTHLAAFRNYRNCVQHNRQPTSVEKMNGEASILWLNSVFDKYELSATIDASENGDGITDPT